MFKQIGLHEFHFWVKGEKEKRTDLAPNLFVVIGWINKVSSTIFTAPLLACLIHPFNQVSAFVATEIISTPNPKHRLSILKQFILVCQYCLKFKNYQGLLGVVYGLQNTAVSRLSCWKELQPKYSEMFEKMAEIVSPNFNWKFYRPVVDTESPPCVPYVGLFLADLTFICDGAPTKLDDGMVNWKKIHRINQQLTKIRHFQAGRYEMFVASTVYVSHNRRQV